MYKVILHNNRKQLKRQPEMEEPTVYPTYIEFKESASQAYTEATIKKCQAYEQHLADCEKNIIDIPDEYQRHWKLDEIVKDSEFEGAIHFTGKNTRIVAIPKANEQPQEKESGRLENIISVGFKNGEADFGIRAAVTELSFTQMNELRSMIIVAIGTMEDMWRRSITENSKTVIEHITKK